MSMPEHTEAIVRNLARLYAMQSRKREVALLAKSEAEMEQIAYDRWDGGTYTYALNLRAPAALYAALGADVAALEEEFLERLKPLLRGYPNEHLGQVVISIELKHDDNWRKNADNWLRSQDLANEERAEEFDFSSRTPARTKTRL